MQDYQFQTKEGMERLVNLINLSYSAVVLLPYCDETFSDAQGMRVQEMHDEVSQQIQAIFILCRFGKFLETMKNSSFLVKVLKHYILSGVKNFQKL